MLARETDVSLNKSANLRLLLSCKTAKRSGNDRRIYVLRKSEGSDCALNADRAAVIAVLDFGFATHGHTAYRTMHSRTEPVPWLLQFGLPAFDAFLLRLGQIVPRRPDEATLACSETAIGEHWSGPHVLEATRPSLTTFNLATSRRFSTGKVGCQSSKQDIGLNTNGQ